MRRPRLRGLRQGAAYAHRGRDHPALLRIRGVVARGALYGLAAVPLLGLASLLVGDHHDRTTFLAVVGGLAAAMAAVGILIGLFFWWACEGDNRRCRDWHTDKGQAGPVTVAAPVPLRIGVLALGCSPAPSGCTTWWTAPGTTAGCTATEPHAADRGCSARHRPSRQACGEGVTRTLDGACSRHDTPVQEVLVNR
ncbi:DUF6336 family protein [Streptomyces tuirus]|uniref:DUF6336 family protein n=1 Tax=Streptomyces tuirus TaxID=68278 RepID=UPI003442AFC6